MGMDKVKRLVEESRSGKVPDQLLTQQDMLGKDPGKIEEDWRAWVEEQKVEGPPGGFRVTTSPGRPPG
jgi:hypothetical protein